jgi:hypothetical protein
MTQQPDKLFQSKLEHFSKPAPAHAWNRLEAQLDKTRYTGIWLKVAASITLLVAATIILWPTESTNLSSQLANSDSNRVKTESPKAVIKQSDQIISKPEKATENVTTQESPTLVHKNNDKKVEIETGLATEPSINLSIVEQENKIMEEVKTVSTETTAAIAYANDEPQSLVITYSAKEVNDKFLKKDLDDATSLEKKPSGIQKLLTLAADIKNTESGFGELREKKNDILAFNFRDDKRGQNK